MRPRGGEWELERERQRVRCHGCEVERGAVLEFRQNWYTIGKGTERKPNKEEPDQREPYFP